MIVDRHIAPCEGEQVVRSYRCTAYRSWLLGIRADGIIEVTNKRLLFQARDAGGVNPNVHHSEMPISEVSGLSVFQGLTFNLSALFGGILLSALVAFVGQEVTSAALLENTDGGVPWVVLWGLALGAGYLAYASRGKPLRAMLFSALALGIVGVIQLMSRAARGYGGSGSGGLATLVFAALVLVQLYLIVKFARRRAFSLLLYSRSANPSPVWISGLSPLDAKLAAASRALAASPAEDSIRMLNELGAVISDIQNLGDFGIEKWRSAPQPGGEAHGAA